MMCLPVVSGEERGNVWFLNNGGEHVPGATLPPPPYPPGDDWRDRVRIRIAFDNMLLGPQRRGRVKFWAWYERWLASELSRVSAGPSAAPDR